MRLAVFLVTLGLCVSASAETAVARNPFSPAPAAPTASPVPAPAGSGAAPAQTQKSALRGAQQLPPQIPPPPPGLRLPPVVPIRDLPPAVDKPADKGRPAAADADAGGEVPQAEPKKDAADGFLSREAIEKARAACRVELKSPAALRISAEGGLTRIQFNNPGAKSCFMGMQSDKPWAAIRGAGPAAAEVEVQPNPTSRPRTTRLVIATANDRWTLVLTQAAGAQELEELELDQDGQ